MRDFETNEGGSPPRILCLDDFVEGGDGGYKYDIAAEPRYRAILFSSFTKIIAKPKLHPLVIVDCVHAAKVRYFVLIKGQKFTC